MRGLSKSIRRSLAAATLLTVIFAHAAAAAETASPGDRLLAKMQAAKQFIITIFARIGTPPG
jgi:hypothetical protein